MPLPLRLRLHSKGAHAASVEAVEKPQVGPILVVLSKQTGSRRYASFQVLQLLPGDGVWSCVLPLPCPFVVIVSACIILA